MKPSPRHILITGASSGLGAALAQRYAAPGVRLSLGARRLDRLEEVAATCRALGARVDIQRVDVEDKAATRAWVEAADAEQPLDLMIANAGISAGTGAGGEGEDQARDIFAVNLVGVLNSIHPAIDQMRARKAGQIALVSSVAGYRGMPGAPAYSASKAAVLAYGEALRGSLGHDGIAISVICPGFVETPMTAVNNFPMPFLMKADRAARIIARDLARNRALITFPWQMRIIAWGLRALPSGFMTRILGRMPEKGGG
jgi:short-subunit dehydrogenase